MIRISHAFRICQKSVRKTQIEARRLIVLPLHEKERLKTWRCGKKQCKAIAITFKENVFTTRESLHRPDVKHSEQLKVLEMMEEKAANSNEQPRKFLQDATTTITCECAVELPNYKSLAKSIQRQCGCGNNATTL